MPDTDSWRHGHAFDEACSGQLQSLSFCSCQTYTVSLCQPNRQQWDHVVFSLTFLLGFFAQCCPDIFFQRWSSFTHENWVSTTVFHISYTASLCEYFLPSSHLSYSMTSFQSTSKGWIPMFEFWKGVYCRCCLLSSLPSHYPLGCIFLLTLEQLGSRRDLWEFG